MSVKRQVMNLPLFFWLLNITIRNTKMAIAKYILLLLFLCFFEVNFAKGYSSSEELTNIAKFKGTSVQVITDKGCGSGTIVSADGIVLTAYHVVKDLSDTSTILVHNYKGRRYLKAKVLSYYNTDISDLMQSRATSDLALIKIYEPDSTFCFSEMVVPDLVEGSDFAFWGYPLCSSEKKRFLR